MCNMEISRVLLLFFCFFPWLFNWKTEMVLFASHRALLKGGGERAFTNEVQQKVNFSNTKCKGRKQNTSRLHNRNVSIC